MTETNGTTNGVEGNAQKLHQRLNPWARRDDHSEGTVLGYKILTLVTWIVLVVNGAVYTFTAPGEGKLTRRTIWGQNSAHPTPFSLNSIIASIYWVLLFILQLGYCYHLYHQDKTFVAAAANVGSHFVVNNLMLFGFLHLWCRSWFWLGEILLIINFFNLTFAYFRHPTTPRIIHIATITGPYAWNWVALFWCGAAMVNAQSLPARIAANIFIWSIFVFGLFFLVVFKDYTMGFALSVLCASLGVSQFLTKVIALQWIFAFVIMGVLFVLSLGIGVPGYFGKEPFKRGEVVSEDRERAPLLADE